jgi:hypothetical protein
MALNQESYKAILAQNISTTAQVSWGSTKKNNFFFFWVLYYSFHIIIKSTPIW